MGPRKGSVRTAKKPNERTRFHAKLLENELSVEVANKIDDIFKSGKINFTDLDEEAIRILRESPTEASLNVLNQLSEFNLDRRSILTALLSKMLELCMLKQASLSTVDTNPATILEGPRTNQPHEVRSGHDNHQPEQASLLNTNSISTIPKQQLQTNQSHESVLENGAGLSNSGFESKLNPAAAEFVPRSVQNRSVDRTRPTGTENRTSNGYNNNFNHYEFQRGNGRQQKFRHDNRFETRRRGNSFNNNAQEVPASQICYLNFDDRYSYSKPLEYLDDVFWDRPTYNGYVLQ